MLKLLVQKLLWQKEETQDSESHRSSHLPAQITAGGRGALQVALGAKADEKVTK